MDVQVNGTTLYAEHAGAGPTLVFVHGMCGDARVWADQVTRLKDRFRCVTYDRRGHTRSPRTNAADTVELHADDLAGLIAALDVGPVVVVGSSGGARVALDLIRRCPHLVRGAVLSEPPVGALAPDLFPAMIGDVAPAVERAAERGGPRAAVDAFFAAVCPGLWQQIDESRKDRYRDNAPMLFADLGMPAYDITQADIARIDIPTLVIAGTTSHPALRAAAHTLAGWLPDARDLELDCGHVTYAEQPDAFANVVSVFADEVHQHSAAATPSTSSVGRLDVQSADGTSLAVWVEGRGPALVLVHGSIADHTTFEPFVEVLRGEWTTYSMDRRGFGASGDTGPYSIERDFDDVAAVVDDVAARTGAPVTVWGHSYGANCAMGAALRTGNVDHLVLYEPSLGLSYPPGVIDRIEAALSAGDEEGAIVTLLAEALDMTDDEIDAFRSSPLWPTRLAAAPTVARECRAEEDWVYWPGQFDAVTAPTLFLTGSETIPELTKATEQANAAISHATLRVLDGHGHFAHKTDPVMVAAVIRRVSRTTRG